MQRPGQPQTLSYISLHLRAQRQMAAAQYLLVAIAAQAQAPEGAAACRAQVHSMGAQFATAALQAGSGVCR
jgi:hypothetical protein